MPDLLLEDFPTRQEHAERMREATDMLIDAALKWSYEPRGSKSEESAAIDLTLACAMYRRLRGDAEYGSLRSAYAEQDEMREARQARALLATKSDEGKDASDEDG